MSARELYEQFKAEHAALIEKYKSPDLNIFTTISVADSDGTTPTYLYYSGSIKEISYSIGEALGKVVLAIEKKRNLTDVSLREQVLQIVLDSALRRWTDDPESTVLAGDQVDVKPAPFAIIRKPGNA